MKVLVVRNASSYDFGGAERLAVHIAKELELNDVDTLVISRQVRLLQYAKDVGVPARKGWWWSRQNWSGIRALGFPVYVAWQCVLVLWYIQLIVRLRPDVVHLMGKDDFIAGTVAGRLLGKGVVWTDPADLKHIFLNHAIWYKNPVGKLVYLVSHLAHAIMLVSKSEIQLTSESVGHALPKNFVVMYSTGKDEVVEHPQARNAADKNAVIFCATSRLVEAKGISDLVQAFNKLVKDSDNYRLWLVGNGPDEERFHAEAKGNNYITFVGHSDKPLTYVAAADVFVHPTHHEGFSLALAESAMLGKPMIATNVGGNPELVTKDNGILVPLKDSDALCKAMQTLGQDRQLRERLGAQARRDYTAHYNFANIVKDVLIPTYEQARSA